MNLKITLFAFILSPMLSIGQISILSTDVPVPAIMNIADIAPTSAASIGTNQTWNYSSYTSSSPSTIDYLPESNSIFTAVGVDVRNQLIKNLTNSLGYNVNHELDFNANGVDDKGFYLEKQPYSVAGFTGNTADSIVFPEQSKLLVNSRPLMKFPMTANSAWTSATRRAVDFNLTVTAFSLMNTPGQHVYTIYRKDSIIGWGTLRVHTPNGPSAPYDVLMDKLEQYSIDSFYLGGSPAPSTLLTAFGVTQGQTMNQQYSYHYYRKGSFNYLMRLTYGADNTYTNLAAAFIHTDNVAPTSVADLKESEYQSLVFPNPCTNGNINIHIIGKTIEEPTVYIIDCMGRIILKQNPALQANGIIRLAIDQSIPKGNYSLQVVNEKDEVVVKEEITVQ